MARTIEDRILEIDAEIEKIKSDAKNKMKILEEKRQLILEKKNKKIMELIQNSGLAELSEDKIKELISNLKK
jgi:hypothetical protein